MPQERPNHYGHLLDKRDETLRNKIEADAVRARRNPPVKTVFFPNVNDALMRRQQRREAFIARTLMVAFVIGLIYALVTGDRFGYVVAGFSFVGFWITCFVAGSRVNRRRLEGS
jgi:hypothetical protein